MARKPTMSPLPITSVEPTVLTLLFEWTALSRKLTILAGNASEVGGRVDLGIRGILRRHLVGEGQAVPELP